MTQKQGTSGIVQKNGNICLTGVVDVSGISGAAAFFSKSTPTIGQLVSAVENKWTGKLTTNRSDWKFGFTSKSQQDMLIKDLSPQELLRAVRSAGSNR